LKLKLLCIAQNKDDEIGSKEPNEAVRGIEIGAAQLAIVRIHQVEIPNKPFAALKPVGIEHLVAGSTVYCDST
jgi:hypothetical protein